MSSSSSSPGASGSPFPVTRWSLVGRAAARGTENGRLALGELVQIYLPALRAHLVGSMRIDPHRADDLLQGFLADRVVEQNMIAMADPKRGKFRTFLLTALERFAIDAHRFDAAQKRAPGSKLLNVEQHLERIPQQRSPSDAFDRTWASEVLSEVMRRMREECEGSERPHLWSVFEARMLLPITDGVPPVPHDELARRLKLESPVQSANALGSAKRLFTRIFRGVVAEYAADREEVDSEIRELWEIFSGPTA